MCVCWCALCESCTWHLHGNPPARTNLRLKQESNSSQNTVFWCFAPPQKTPKFGIFLGGSVCASFGLVLGGNIPRIPRFSWPSHQNPKNSKLFLAESPESQEFQDFPGQVPRIPRIPSFSWPYPGIFWNIWNIWTWSRTPRIPRFSWPSPQNPENSKIFLAMSRNILEYVEFFGLGQSDLGILGILGNLGIPGILGTLPGKSWNSRELHILGGLKIWKI